MIHQYLLKKLSEKDQQIVLKKKGDRLVHIHSNNGYWRPDAKGYTDDKAQAWVLTFREAWEETKHCGPEKHVRYPYHNKEVIERTPLNCEDQSINIYDRNIKTAEFGD